MRSRKNTASQFGEFYDAMRRDIYVFCRALNYQPSHQHRQLLDAVQAAIHGKAPAKIAVKSGQGPGKTKCSGVVGLYLLLCAPYTKLLLTAPTMAQCKDAWLAEAKRTVRGADPLLQRLYNFTNTGIGVLGHKPADWGCIMRTATKAENAQGQHAKDMHLIVEEASGVAKEIIEQYKGTLSNPNAIFIQIGNPNSRDCPFFDCFHSQKHRWSTYTWSAEDVPASEWFDPQRNRDLEDEYGRESDVYRVRVLGEFPNSDPNCVISSEDVEACMDRKLLIPCTKLSTAKQLGIDFARFGGDESAIYRRSGNAIVESFVKSKVDPEDALAKAVQMMTLAGWRRDDTWFIADAGGLGQGMMGGMHRQGLRVVEFHNGGRAQDSQYANKITQAYFELAKMLRAKEAYMPYDRTLVTQLSGRQYYLNTKGKLILEKKEDYVKRGNDSPDRADGAVMAMWNHPVVSAAISSMMSGSQKRVGHI
jgi:hypothetical protein